MSHTIVLDNGALHVRAVLNNNQDWQDLVTALNAARTKYWNVTEQPSHLKPPKELT